MEQVTRSSIQYAVAEESQINRSPQLNLLFLLSLSLIGLLFLAYILKKFRHDILNRIYSWIILFICRCCFCQNLENALSQDTLSITSSSCDSKNTTSLKRRLSSNLEHGVSTESSSDSKDSLTSKEIPWNSMIGTEANNIRKKILFDSDFESAHSDSKPSMISEVSTPPSSIIERCSIETNTDSNPCADRIEDKSIKVSKDELCNSDCEDSSTTTTPDRSDSNNNYLITRSGKRFYKDI